MTGFDALFWFFLLPVGIFLWLLAVAFAAVAVIHLVEWWRNR